jgi:pyrroloquinoline-quinone synthase
MKFAQHLITQLSEKNLLKHEFYQKWNEGSIPVETLQLYARQYYHHVSAFPRYLSATHSHCEDIEKRQILLENLRDEEEGPDHHPELWLRFAQALGVSQEQVKSEELLPETRELIDTFMQSSRKSFASGLGALFAYEHQVPEIATFKIEALKKHYAMKDGPGTSFFEVHRKADVYHTEALSQLLESLTPEEKAEVQNSAQIASHQLWKFLDGIYRTMCSN